MEGLVSVVESIEKMCTVPTAAISDDALVTSIVDVHRAQSLLAAQEARLLDAVDRRGVWRVDGSKALWSWHTRATNSSPATAKTMVHLMKGLRLAPLTQTAFQAGAIDLDRAKELASRATSKRTP